LAFDFSCSTFDKGFKDSSSAARDARQESMQDGAEHLVLASSYAEGVVNLYPGTGQPLMIALASKGVVECQWAGWLLK
jgi:hypothetical protein